MGNVDKGELQNQDEILAGQKHVLLHIPFISLIGYIRLHVYESSSNSIRN